MRPHPSTGRGFSVRNVWLMRAFYLGWPIMQTPSAESLLDAIRSRFPLPWSVYVRLLSVRNQRARTFYEAEALRGGWTVRQLDRQINTQFYERTALSRNKAALLGKGGRARPGDRVLPEEEKEQRTTKADLVEQAADALEPRVTKRDCGLVVDAFLNAVKIALARGDHIGIRALAPSRWGTARPVRPATPAPERRSRFRPAMCRSSNRRGTPQPGGAR